MKPLKLVILSVIVTVVMTISWVIGTLAGNALTHSAPPPPSDAANAGLAFLAVCAFNSVLITLLLETTASYKGVRRGMVIFLYVFGIQFLLPQMETYFFGGDIGISRDQTTAILISGLVVSIITLPVAMAIYKKLIGTPRVAKPLTLPYRAGKRSLLLLALLIFIVYPFLYLTFGYYVAWQNESLRVYYTQSTTKTPYLQGIADAFSNGIYFFQVLRALLWVAVTVPVVVMLKERPMAQFVVVGLLTALLPTSLLFIPNPYMPWDIAMTHFVETSTSNFVWGLVMVWVWRRAR